MITREKLEAIIHDLKNPSEPEIIPPKFFISKRFMKMAWGIDCDKGKYKGRINRKKLRRRLKFRDGLR